MKDIPHMSKKNHGSDYPEMVSVGEADEDLALATRAAWLYHAGALTQSEVAVKLGVTSVRAHRLIARATRAGLVRVSVEGPIGGCIALEETLMARHGLRFCRVVPSLGEAGIPFRALGAASATVLRDVLERGEHTIIGVGHGRTLAAMVHHLPRTEAPHVHVVSLLGGVPRHTSANPYDVIHRLAEKTGAGAWLVPVPFFANTEADRAVLLAQRGIAEAFDMAARATVCFVGIGEVAGDAFLSASAMISNAEIAQLRAHGAVGELLGRYLDADGRSIETPLHNRVISLPLASLAGRDVVAVAGGPGKVAAIRSVLKGQVLNGLITDEPTASALLGAEPTTKPTRPTRGNQESCTRKQETSQPRSFGAGSAAAN